MNVSLIDEYFKSKFSNFLYNAYNEYFHSNPEIGIFGSEYKKNRLETHTTVSLKNTNNVPN